MKKYIYILTSLLIISSVHATIINVPDNQPTIQAGIDVANTGDTVLVQPGTYLENINYNGKNITVASHFLITQDTSYIWQTIINGNDAGSVVIFENGEDSIAVLTGFTITNGLSNVGGGICCVNASPKLTYLLIAGNENHWSYNYIGGAGLYCDNSILIMDHVTLIENTSYITFGLGFQNGGGICCINSDIRITNSAVKFNSAVSGGGIYCDNSNPLLINVTIENNTAVPDFNPMWGGVFYDSWGGGMSCENGSNPTLQNVIIRDNIAQSGFSPNSSSSGGGIYCENSNPVFQQVEITNNSSTNISYGPAGLNCGGGIFFTGSDPMMNNVLIRANEAGSGGGIYFDNSCPDLKAVTISNNLAALKGGGIFISSSIPDFDSIHRSNIFFNTSLTTGNDLFSDTVINVIVDTFTVLNPTPYHAEPLAMYSFDILNGKRAQINADLYVSPEGDNSNSGLTPNDPLKNIRFAFAIILADSLHQHTIHLLNGTYGDSTNNEILPLNIPDFVNLDGEEKDSVILDASSKPGALAVNNNISNQIRHLTITGAYNDGISINGSDPEFSGITITNCQNGIICDSSSPTIDSITIVNKTGSGFFCTNNSNPYVSHSQFASNLDFGVRCENNSNPVLKNVQIADNFNGGLECFYSNPVLEDVCISGNSNENGGGIFCEHSNPELTGVVVNNNTASANGGGMYCYDSDPALDSTIISDNESAYGGGMFIMYNSQPDLEFVTVSYNSAQKGGGFYCSSSSPLFSETNRCNIYLNSARSGNDLFSDTLVNVVVDTFTVLYPTGYFTTPFNKFTFDILHGKKEQVNADLYVSPDGDNTNSGLTPNDPLQTIYYAFSIMMADSLNPHTINLLEGTYSDSTSGEVYPLYMIDHIGLAGVSQQGAILDGKGSSEVLIMDQNAGIILADLSVTGGSNDAIYIIACDPELQNITVLNNTGTGIYCDQSNPEIVGGTIIENEIGMYCENTADPYLNNILISGNSDRGIICTNNSNPLMENVLITNNVGGIHCIESSPTLRNVTISENAISGFWANSFGGGINCDQSSPYLENVIITNNSVSKNWWNDGGWGGGIYCTNFSNPVLKNVLVEGNYAEHTGAGMACYVDCNPVLINVTFTNNVSDNTGGAVYNYLTSHPAITNSIMWNNMPQEIFSSNIDISYSDIQGGWEGEGNIDEDPMFTGTGNFPFSLSDNSPCIDKGNPDTTGLNLPEFDLAGNLRLKGGRIDMGAYENQSVTTVITHGGQTDKFYSQCSPNPCKGELTITFTLSESVRMAIDIYNQQGEKEMEIVNQFLPEGKHVYSFDAENLPSGIYFVRLQVGVKAETRKIIKL